MAFSRFTRTLADWSLESSDSSESSSRGFRHRRNQCDLVTTFSFLFSSGRVLHNNSVGLHFENLGCRDGHPPAEPPAGEEPFQAERSGRKLHVRTPPERAASLGHDRLSEDG